MTRDFLNKKVILGITGGIAAYKSAFLIRELTALGAIVRVVMTPAATSFITPLTCQALSGQPVHTELLDESAERAMGHIELARWADMIVIAPATADCLAKLAHGLADDLLSTLCLVTRAPLLVCPAMNHDMWSHPATVDNCALLKSRLVQFIGPEFGEQACQEVGFGRLSDVEMIIDAMRLHDVVGLLAGESVMITAGATQEPVDPIRYLTNYSSGKMGYALAKAAQVAGARVILISGPTHLPCPSGVHRIDVTSAGSMHDAVMQHLSKDMIFMGAAAVADYHVVSPSLEKIKKSSADLTLSLVENQDIIAAVASKNRPKWVVGFAAETDNVIQYAEKKLKSKQLDMIIANQVGHGLVFDSDENEVTVLTSETQMTLPRLNKVRLAGELIAIIIQRIHDDKKHSN
jgi:phosphopantothenoylcysteine decarboxylase/phosphopantothenate--cysteine ligase